MTLDGDRMQQLTAALSLSPFLLLLLLPTALARNSSAPAAAAAIAVDLLGAATIYRRPLHLEMCRIKNSPVIVLIFIRLIRTTLGVG